MNWIYYDNGKDNNYTVLFKTWSVVTGTGIMAIESIIDK